MKILTKIFLVGIFLSILSSCCVVHTDFMAINKIATTPREMESVEYLLIKPNRSAVCLGYISLNGNGFSSHDNLIMEAKKKAAELGGDFILNEKSGTETKTVYNPGYSNYQSNGNAFVSGGSNSIYGSANQNATGYSVGPSISTHNFPWSIFSCWIYTPSNIGIGFDDNEIVTGFHLNSDAELVGMMIGDKIIGVDGLDVKDDALSQHLMEIDSGDKITFTISRSGQRINFDVTALKNY